MVPPASDKILVSRRTQDPIRLTRISVTGLSPLRPGFDPVLLSSFLPYHGPSTPVLQPWFGLSRSPPLRNHCFSSGYLDVSSSPGTSLQAMYSPADDSSCLLPDLIRHFRFFASLQLHGAFRSLASFFSFEWARHSLYAPSLLNQWFSCVSRCSFSRTVFYCFSQFILQLTF